MITITERKLQTYLYSLIIITPNTKCECGFRNIFCQNLFKVFGQIVSRLIIRPHFSGAHFFWDPFVGCPFAPGPICPGAHLSRGPFVRGPFVRGPFVRGSICPKIDINRLNVCLTCFQSRYCTV